MKCKCGKKNWRLDDVEKMRMGVVCLDCERWYIIEGECVEVTT